MDTQLSPEKARRLAALERRGSRGQKASRKYPSSVSPLDVQNAFKAIRDQELYRGKYETFEAYCEFEWGYYGKDLEDLLTADHRFIVPEPRAHHEPEPPRTTGVYFAQCGTHPLVKIGFASNISARLKLLQTGCPFPLVLLGSFEGGQAEEMELHRRFAHLRVQGEWFTMDDELRLFIVSAGGEQ